MSSIALQVFILMLLNAINNKKEYILFSLSGYIEEATISFVKEV